MVDLLWESDRGASPVRLTVAKRRGDRDASPVRLTAVDGANEVDRVYADVDLVPAPPWVARS